MILPIRRMDERVRISREDSDSVMFFDLAKEAEMVLKLIVSAMVACLADDRERTRYRQIYRLVRASSLGDWSAVLTEVLTGPSSQHLVPEARDLQRDIAQKVSDTWIREAVEAMDEVLQILGIPREPLGKKSNVLLWAELTVRLRNKGPGHGSQPSHKTSTAAVPLEASVRLLTSNALIFQQEWAYLKKNLSGKYNVIPISDEAPSFDYLKSSKE